MEQPEIMEWRLKYLHALKRHQEENKLIIYLDEKFGELPKVLIQNTQENAVNMWKKALEHVTPNMWQNSMEHTNKIIHEWLQRELIFDRVEIAPLIINSLTMTLLKEMI
jgi:hypothetical protein